MTDSNTASVTPIATPATPERTYLDSEATAHAAESARLRDLDYVRALGAKSGKRLARKAFAARVDALRK